MNVRIKVNQIMRMFKNLPSDIDRIVSDTSQILRLLQQRPPRTLTGTVLVLWKSEAGAPSCLSESVEFDPSVRNVRTIETNFPIPAGAWVVSLGCTLAGVYIGNEMQDLGINSRSPVVVLRYPVDPGVRLTVSLKE